MNFEFPEDQAYFEKLLIGEDRALSIHYFSSLFEFGDPIFKRKEFKCIRHSVFSALVDTNGLACNNCNNHKKHRILYGMKLRKILATKKL